MMPFLSFSTLCQSGGVSSKVLGLFHTDNKYPFIYLTDPPYYTYHKVINVFPSLSSVISAQSIQHNKISNSVYHVHHPIPMQQQAKNQAPDNWYDNLIVVITNNFAIETKVDNVDGSVACDVLPLFSPTSSHFPLLDSCNNTHALATIHPTFSAVEIDDIEESIATLK